MRNFLEGRIRLLQQRASQTEIPESILAIVRLWGFTSYFEPDGFWDYSNQALAKNDELTSERQAFLSALKRVGMQSDAERIEQLWSNPSRDEHALVALQEEHWSPEGRQVFQERMHAFIRSARQGILEFDRVAKKIC